MTDLEEPIYPERGSEETAIRGGGALQQAAEVSAILAPVVSQVIGLSPGVDNPKT